MHHLSDRELVELLSEQIATLKPELLQLILMQGRSRRAGFDPLASAVAEVEAFNARAESKRRDQFAVSSPKTTNAQTDAPHSQSSGKGERRP